jgi:hypothetical protein
MVVPRIPSLRGKIPDEAAAAIEELYRQLNQVNNRVTNESLNLQSAIQGVGAKVGSQAAQLSQALSIIPSAQLLSGGVSSGINTQGSVLPTPTGGLLYNNATASTIIWYYTGLIIYLPDGTQIPVPDTTVANPSISISGLTPSTTYNFYPYYSVDFKTVLWAVAPGGTGTPAAAYVAKSILAAQIANGDGNIAISPQSSVTAAATGGGGGGGGGGGSGCIRQSMLVQTRRSLLRLGNCRVGEEILGPEGWTIVSKKHTSTQPEFLRFTFGLGEYLEVTPSHIMNLYKTGFPSPAKSWTMADMLKSRCGLPAKLMSISVVSEADEASLVECNPYHEFFVGATTAGLVLTNSVPIK